MRLIDTHCHLYLKEFSNDIEEVITRANQEGIDRFYLPNIDSGSIEDMMELEKRFADKCFAMMGLHPGSVKTNYREELKKVESWFGKRRFAAVGEVGLDFYWDTTYTKDQYKAFERQIEWALQHDLPVVIHSRNSLQECIDAINRYQQGRLKGIFHCFTGSSEEAQRIIDLGFYLGIGGVVTYKNSGLAQVIEKTGLDHVVLETDAPYLTPAPFRGKRNESSYLKYVAEKIADIKRISVEEVALVTTANAEKLFGV